MAVRKKRNPVSELWHKVPSYLRNRYFVTLLLFLILMIFIDRHDVGTQFRLQSTVDRLEADLDRYDELTAAAEAEKLDMEQNRERFARENYYMQQDDEDVFIVTPEK